MKKSSTINQGAGSNSNNSGCITDITGQLGKTEHGTHAVTAMATNNKNVRTGKIWIGGCGVSMQGRCSFIGKKTVVAILVASCCHRMSGDNGNCLAIRQKKILEQPELMVMTNVAAKE